MPDWISGLLGALKAIGRAVAVWGERQRNAEIREAGRAQQNADQLREDRDAEIRSNAVRRRTSDGRMRDPFDQSNA